MQLKKMTIKLAIVADARGIRHQSLIAGQNDNAASLFAARWVGFVDGIEIRRADAARDHRLHLRLMEQMLLVKM
jgi:hypothetical protein